ncbi:MAG TPA: hypothetical protein VN088_19700 [Nocardioides sp.]|nr:hypothetical protein [Nocardioides sp.]
MSPVTDPGGRPVTPATIWPPRPVVQLSHVRVVTQEDVEDAKVTRLTGELLTADLVHAEPTEPAPAEPPASRMDGLSRYLPQVGAVVTCRFDPAGVKLSGHLEAVIRDAAGDPTHLVLRRIDPHRNGVRVNRRLVSLSAPTVISYDVEPRVADYAVAAKPDRAKD